MEDHIERSNRRLILIVSGFVGIVAGLFSEMIPGIGHLLMWAGVLLWFAELARGNADRSSKGNLRKRCRLWRDDLDRLRPAHPHDILTVQVRPVFRIAA